MHVYASVNVSSVHVMSLKRHLLVQINLEKISSNIEALEAKLVHEKAKFKDFNRDLKDAQKR
jgi:hypothetical protein